MITALLIPLLLFILSYVSYQKDWIVSLLSSFVAGISSIALLGVTIGSFFFPNVNTINYKPVSIIQATDEGVVEIVEDVYYKDENGEYYVISQEFPKFSEHLWNPIIYANMEKVDHSLIEMDKNDRLCLS